MVYPQRSFVLLVYFSVLYRNLWLSSSHDSPLIVGGIEQWHLGQHVQKPYVKLGMTAFEFIDSQTDRNVAQ